MTWPEDVPWNDGHDSLADHFHRYGADVRARTSTDFLRLVHQTMRDSIRFTFRRGPRARVGYYHARTGRFVVLTGGENAILSLSKRSENHVRQLPDSTYGAK